jgi:hypothetical protein
MKKKLVFMLLIALFTFSVNIVASNDVVPSTKKVEKGESVDSTKLSDAVTLEVLSNIAKKKTEEDQKMNMVINNDSPAVPLSAFLMIIVIVFCIQFYRFKKKKELYLLFSKFIESGKDIPIELLQPKRKRSDLRTGLIFLAIGIAISIGAFVIDKDILLIGIIPLFLGIAFIVFHFLNKKKNDNQ